MLIANPIYDSVFKFLMEDLRAAKALISGILGETVEVLQFCPQETAIELQPFTVTIYRLDFKAVILNADGSRRKVLIEMQKAKQHFDIMRFRHYLGDNYSRHDVVDGKEEVLPIVTIYFLGFNLGVKVPVVSVGRVYTDAATGSAIDKHDDFIEKLTHDSFVVQIPRLPVHAQNRLERLLSVFSQKWKKDGERDWTLQYLPDETEKADPNLQFLLSRLSEAAGDDQVRTAVRIEKEMERTILKDWREMERKLALRETIIGEKDMLIGEKEAIIGEKNMLIGEKEAIIGEKEAIIGKKDTLIGEKEQALDTERQRRKAIEKELAELRKKYEE